ncbi:MAG: peptide chain release factor N(5)-glutamine methyltransferase [Bacteroidales bacterium]|nr:peptide chain release factor N(5)-glutamine methyltransferase [Bacteroidales bacterium]
MQHTIQLLRDALSTQYDAREVKAQIRLLLEEVCGLSYTQIVMADYRSVTPDQRERLARCAEPLSRGIPVQQVLGYAWFRGRRFGVNEHVLIPRPETAELVDLIVSDFAAKEVAEPVDKPVHNPVENGADNPLDNSVYNLLDIGTGSGCIALSLAADINRSLITAADISTDALITAENNTKSLGINNVRFVQADILKEATEDFCTELSTLPGDNDEVPTAPRSAQYDAIVSNPPYICQRERVDMSANVLDHEPHLALFVPDSDPLLFYRTIGQYALRHLRPGGRLYFEINVAYGAETCDLLRSLGYTEVELRQDMEGRDRMVRARLDNRDIIPL